MITLSNDMRLHGMTLFNKYPRVHHVESFKDDIKALSQTAEERKRSISEARTEPRVVTDQVYENTRENTGIKRKASEIPSKFGGKRRNKTRGKSRRTRTRKSRKSRKSRRTRK